MTSLELLSPAGSADALNAAIRSGADAVYLGLGDFNARRNAQNFSAESLRAACAYAHLRGAHVYVTLNTLILPGEVRDALKCARTAYECGADALIVQDIGIAHQVAHAFPGCPVHISTQANTHDAWGIEAAALLGADRVTLARELSLEEIAHLSAIAADHGMQTEVFVHGALCTCYSGQCLMSSMIGQRSANRGVCAQACRLPYALEEDGHPVAEGESFLLSPKDLCGVDLIPQLVEAGVSSFKIEGRMKSPEYVSAVTAVYRRALDALMEGAAGPAPAEDKALLESVFTRGFTTAYLEGDRTDAMMSYQRPNNRGAFIGRVKSVKDGIAAIQCEHPLVEGDVIEFWTGRGRAAQTVPAGFHPDGRIARIPLDAKAAGVRAADRVFRVRSAEAAFAPDPFEPRVPVDCTADAVIGEPLQVGFQVPAAQAAASSPAEEAIIRRLHEAVPEDALQVRERGSEVEPARSKEISAEDMRQHIGRMGQTPFRMASFRADVSEGGGLGFAELHRVRAHALEELEAQIGEPYAHRAPVKLEAPKAAQSERPSAEPSIAALATNPECARAAKRAGAQAVYVPALNYRRGQAAMEGALMPQASQASYPSSCIIQMPEVAHDAVGSSREAALGIDPWEYAQAGKPVLVESFAGLVRAVAEDALPQVGSMLPLTNALSIQLAARLGAQMAWLSPELDINQIEDLAAASPIPLGVKVAGAMQLMVTEHCPLMPLGACEQTCAGCRRRMGAHALRDRKDYRFPLAVDALGRGHLYNSVPLDAVPVIPRLLDAGITAFLVDATLMDPERTAQAVGRAVHALESARAGRPAETKLPGTTSGHLFRGVV